MSIRETEIRRDLSWLQCPRTNADFWASSLTARPAERELTDRIFAELYAYLGRPKPQLLWFDGPQSCLLAGVLAGPTRFGKPLAPRHMSPFDLASDEFEPLLGRVLERQMKDDFLLSCPDVGDGELMGHGIWGGRNRCRLRNAAGEYNAKLSELDSPQCYCGPWFPFEHVVLCSERHRHIHFDAAHRVHDEHGLAIGYRDGSALYVWHGTHVPADWIERRDTMDPSISMKTRGGSPPIELESQLR